MAPLPKRKYPKTRQRKRRGHHRLRVPHVVTCSDCRAPRLSHQTCPVCGLYRGREVLRMPDPDLEG